MVIMPTSLSGTQLVPTDLNLSGTVYQFLTKWPLERGVAIRGVGNVVYSRMYCINTGQLRYKR